MVKLHVSWKLYEGSGVALLTLAIVSLYGSSAGTAENVILGGLFVVVIITGAVAFFLSRNIAGGIGQIAAALKAISVGNLGMKIHSESKGDLGNMAAACRDLQAYLDGYMPWAAEHIADGSLADEVKPKIGRRRRGQRPRQDDQHDQNDPSSLVSESADRMAKPCTRGDTAGQVVLGSRPVGIQSAGYDRQR